MNPMIEQAHTRPGETPDEQTRPPSGGSERRRRNSIWRNYLNVPAAAMALVLLTLEAIHLWAIWDGGENGALFLALHTLFLLLAFALLGGIFLVTRQYLHRPLDHLQQWAQRMRGGELSARVSLPGNGEFDDLAQDINSLSQKLETLSLNMQKEVARQTERIQQKTHSLEVLYDVAASINASRDLDDLLTRFLHTLKGVVNAEAATVRLVQQDDQMQLIAASGLAPEIVEQEKLVDINRCLCGKAAQQGLLLTQPDTATCSRYAGRPFFDTDDREMIAVPLQYRGKVLGVYNLFTPEQDLVRREDMQELLTSIGHHLGMAIEKARLDEEANLLSIMEERTRLAHELHDSLAQSLASLRFQVRVLDETLHEGKEEALWRELERIENSLDEAYTELRELIAHFRAPMDKRGLIPAVQQAVERFRRETDIYAFLQKEWSDEPLPADTEMQVLRIIQEALANIRKHSKASHVRVMLRACDDGEYRVLVEDDGVGFAGTVDGGPGEHVGLKILHERAIRLGGTLRIESEPGEGTRILLKFKRPQETEEFPVTINSRHAASS